MAGSHFLKDFVFPLLYRLGHYHRQIVEPPDGTA